MVAHSEFIHLGEQGILQAEELGLKPFSERFDHERYQAKVILGHKVDVNTSSLVPKKNPKHITFLRDPAERIVSLYNFKMAYQFVNKGKQPEPFDSWWNTSRKMSTIKFICKRFLKIQPGKLKPRETFQAALSTLERFWLVGTMETFTHDCSLIMKTLELPQIPEGERSNVSGKHFDIQVKMSDEIREMIYKDCPYDVDLHRYFLQRRRAHMSSGH